jgi:hypothetical protein
VVHNAAQALKQSKLQPLSADGSQTFAIVAYVRIADVVRRISRQMRQYVNFAPVEQKPQIVVFVLTAKAPALTSMNYLDL